MKPKAIVKLFSIAAVSVASALVGVFFLRYVFNQLQFDLQLPTWNVLVQFIAGLVLLFLAYAFFGIFCVLAKRKYLGLIVSMFFPSGLLLAMGINLYTLLAALLWLIGLTQFAVRINEEVRDRRRVRIASYLAPGLSLGLTALLLAISFCFYGVSVQRGTASLEPSEAIAQIVVPRVNQYLIARYPGYNENMTVNEFLFLLIVKAGSDAKPAGAAALAPTTSIVPGNLPTKLSEATSGTAPNTPNFLNIDINSITEQLQNIPADDILNQLPPDFLDQVKNNPNLVNTTYQRLADQFVGQEISQASDNIIKKLGIKAKGTDPIGQVFRQIIAQKLKDVFGPFTYLIPPILALALFSLLEIFNFIYVFIVTIFSFSLFTILKWTGFHRITNETGPIEIIRID